MKKLICLLLCVLLAVSLCACGGGNGGSQGMTEEEMLVKWGKNYDPANAIVEQDKYLFGMCYIAPSSPQKDRLNDYETVYRVLANMGVKSLRHWIHFHYVMTDPTTFREDRVAYQHALLAEAKKYGFQIIGMNHTNYIDGGFVGPKHKYQPWEGSDYYKWLEDYETSWYTLAKEFPEITYWEIDNEINNPDFMRIYGDEDGYLPVEEMVAIGLDMMFYGSRGIHRANPDAITVMGSLTEPWGLGKAMSKTYPGVGKVTYATNAEFLEMMYQAIESGAHGSIYPDDFFQVACWHPYYWNSTPSDQYWIDENNKIYDVIKRHEGKDKKVFLTEIGWRSLETRSNEEIAGRVNDLYRTVKANMPYVEAVHYFRMFDDVNLNNQTAGLFYDPRIGETYETAPYGKGTLAAPKVGAYVYQALAGGSGPLDLLME